MISEWFTDRLRVNGHSRLDETVGPYRGRWWKEDAIVDRVRENFPHVIALTMYEAVKVSRDVHDYIEANEIMLGPWTSFRVDEEVYFAFRVEASAAKFRLILPTAD